MRRELIEVSVVLHVDSPHASAIKVSDDGEKKHSVWLPRSQIEYDHDAREGDVVTVTMPEWLATAKGLI